MMTSNTPPAKSLGVCLASLSFYPLYAGPAVRFQRYAPGLARRGVHMRVFTQAVTAELLARDGSLANGNGRTPDLPPLTETVDGIAIQRVALPTGLRQQAAYFRRLAQYCHQHRAEIDVVQLLNADILAAPWLYQLRRMGLGTVFTHTLLGDLSAKPWKRQLQRLHRRLPLNMINNIVVSSSAMQQRLVELGVSTPIHVIANGVDTNRFRPVGDAQAKRTLRQKLGLDPDSTMILAIGPIIPRKGTEVLVEAFTSLCAQYPQAHLVLVGPRHDLERPNLATFRNHIQQTMTAAQAENHITFTGAVSNVEDYLQAADILVFPSRREGMPNVVPEAMACALPLVLTPFIGLPQEFGRAGEHYLLSDWQPQQLAADIKTLLADETRRQQMGQAAHQWITANMSVERSLDSYADLYRHLSRKTS